ncbi:TrkA family potassium uptake protein [Paenibacillus pini]
MDRGVNWREMKIQQFVVIGLGRFGSSLALELMDLGYEVLGLDKNEEIVNDLSDQLTHTVVADATDEEVLKSLGIRNFDCGIVAIGDDIQMSILAAILLKELGVQTVVAKAISILHGRALEKLGVDRVIFPERDMGIRVAHQLVTPNLVDYIEISKDYSIVEMTVPATLDGRTLNEVNTRTRFGCSIVALHRPGGIIIAPTAMDKLQTGDIMVIIGSNVNIDRFEKEAADIN